MERGQRRKQLRLVQHLQTSCLLWLGLGLGLGLRMEERQRKQQ